MNRDAEYVIEKIKKRKAEKGLTNKQLSELSGVSEGTLNKILGTETKDPSVGNILKILDALDLPEDYALAERTSPLSEKEEQLIFSFRKLNPDGQTAALAAVNGFTMLDQYVLKKCDDISKIS